LNGGSTVNTFIPKPHEVKLYLLQQLLAASQAGNAIGFRQLLCATSFDTLELEIVINYSVYSQSVNDSLT